MSSTRSERPVVHTRVGRALIGDNHFRGRSVARELMGRPMAALYALAIGGPELTSEQTRIVDALVSAALASDPRIWPLKVAPLVASYGSTLAGFAAATSYFEGMMVSPMQAENAAHALLTIRERADQGEHLDAILDSWRGHVAGFGVPARAHDERVLAFSAWYEANTSADARPYWELRRRVMLARPSMRPNITSCAAAAALDLGFDAHQAGLLLTSCAMLCAIATSVEASANSEPALKCIPPRFIDYRGPCAATSPRASSSSSGYR